MLPEFLLLKAFDLALAAGAAAAWLTHKTPDDKEDELITKAHELVLGMVSDADCTKRVWAVTDKDWRDQLTVAEAEELNRERELRGMKNRN